MIVSCISAKEPYVSNPANNIGDLSPATFRVLFDEGIELQNAQIELISAKVSRLNEIVINDDNASFAVRMGEQTLCNQIKCKIPSGTYKTSQDLADACAKELNDKMPVNAYRGGPQSDEWNTGGGPCGWSGSVVGTNITLTWNRCLYPNPLDPAPDLASDVFKGIQNNKEKVNQLGDAVCEPVENTNVGLLNNWTKYECSDAVKTNIRSNVLVPTWSVPNSNDNQYDYCQGLDLGSNIPDYLSRKSWDNFGPFEGRGGSYNAVIRPIRCVTRSSYDAGYSGFDPTGSPTNKPSYWTFEFRPNKDDAGDTILGDYKYGSLFPEDSLKHSIPHPPIEKSETDGLSTINGCLLHAVEGNEIRGPPYNVKKVLQLPYSVKATSGQPTLRRKLSLKTTWTGQIEFGGGEGESGATVGQAGLPYLNTPVPDHYTFQMNNNAPAYSLVRRHGAETDKVRVRMTHRGLMAGLPQQNALNGPIVDTTIQAPLIQVPQVGEPSSIQYIRGTVGRYNSWEGDAAVEGDIRDGNNQGHLNVPTREKKDFRLPFYKIIEVDGNPALKYGNAPTKILTIDSGEYIEVATDQDSTLWLNDPNTWRFKPGFGASNPSSVLLSQMYRVMPTAGDIMYDTAPEVEKTLDFRYPSFNIGLIRDDIHHSQILNSDKFIRENYSKFGKSGRKAFDVPKTLECVIQSQWEDSNGNVIPSAGVGNGAMRVYCSQLQPATPDDAYYQKNYDVSDEKKTIINAASNSWNNCTGDGVGPRVLNNWTNFQGVNNGTGAVKIEVVLSGMYNYSIIVSHTDDVTASPIAWQDRTYLVSTGVTRTTNNGIPYNKMESFMKARFFPLHPVCSILPSSTEEKNEVWLNARGTTYPLKPLGDGLGLVNNYQFNEKNILGVANKRWRTYQNIEHPSSNTQGNPDGDVPRIMLKFKKLFESQVALVPSPPVPNPLTGVVGVEDFEPQSVGSLYNAGFHSVYYAQNAAAVFSANTPPQKQAYLPTYVVEIKNLPLSGYISKAFDYGRLDEKKGSGQRRSIVGVVPAFELTEADFTKDVVNYLYNAPFSQPVNLRLPTKQFFYHFDIDLRSILDGKLLNQLIHSSEIVLRITPMQ